MIKILIPVLAEIKLAEKNQTSVIHFIIPV